MPGKLFPIDGPVAKEDIVDGELEHVWVDFTGRFL